MRVLLVCTGNLCRSPMAQAVGTRLARGVGVMARFEFDSAGTHALAHAASPDPRAARLLERAGYPTKKRRTRQVQARDFDAHDLVLAMDHGHLAELRRLCPPEHAHKLRLLMDFAPGHEGEEIPDPYFGDLAGFERVLALCEAGVRGLLSPERQAAAIGALRDS